MLNMKNIGQKICKFRKEKNMTQLELADRLNISFQAVSNWERGKSMPDISKLPELCEILDITIDELLGKNIKIIENITNENIDNYLEENEIDLDEFKEVAPILKPNQTKKIFEKGISKKIDFENKNTNISISEICSIAPFIDEDDLDNIVIKFYENNMIDNINDLITIVPFLSDDAISNIAYKVVCNNNLDDIEDLVWLAPFIDDETLDDIVLKIYENNGLDSIIAFAPFLSSDAISNIINTCISNGNMDLLSDFAPFIKKGKINNL